MTATWWRPSRGRSIYDVAFTPSGRYARPIILVARPTKTELETSIRAWELAREAFLVARRRHAPDTWRAFEIYTAARKALPWYGIESPFVAALSAHVDVHTITVGPSARGDEVEPVAAYLGQYFDQVDRNLVAVGADADLVAGLIPLVGLGAILTLGGRLTPERARQRAGVPIAGPWVNLFETDRPGFWRSLVGIRWPGPLWSASVNIGQTGIRDPRPWLTPEAVEPWWIRQGWLDSLEGAAPRAHQATRPRLALEGGPS